MKQTIKNLFLLSLFALVLTGCSKDDDAVMDDSYSVDQKIAIDGIGIENGGTTTTTTTTGNGGTNQTAWTTPLYRWDWPGVDHFYSTNIQELHSNGGPYPQYTWDNWTPYRYEGVAFRVFSNGGGDLVPLYRYYHLSSSDTMLTVGTSELGNPGRNGWKLHGIVGYIYPKNYQTPAPILNSTKPIYRYYNGKIKDHFYTTNWNELRGGRGHWRYEGVIGYAPQ